MYKRCCFISVSHYVSYTDEFTALDFNKFTGHEDFRYLAYRQKSGRLIYIWEINIVRIKQNIVAIDHRKLISFTPVLSSSCFMISTQPFTGQCYVYEYSGLSRVRRDKL